MKFDINELNYQLGHLDYGSFYFGTVEKNKIYFDNDPKGDGIGPFLKLICYKNYIKITRGSHLNEGEMGARFNYSAYDDTKELARTIAKFTKSYFKSIKTVYIRT